MLDIRLTETNRIAVIEAQGRVDSSTAGQLGDALTSAIDDGLVWIVLDLAGVDYMSSAGLREIVSALKKVRGAQGDMRIAQATERVYDVLEMSGLNTIFRIFDSRADAIHSF
ncbi:MAG: STAS domain-containing protein [Anaerolineae bacterium]|nr:STAS domain-containing protein [Anaerolineae bacterium]